MSQISPAAPSPDRRGRDTSRDGWRNRFEDYVLRHFRPVWTLINRSSFLLRKANAVIVDVIVSKAPSRPLALSTMSPYTSWPSLTDRTWFSRYVPPRPPAGLPDIARVMELFEVKASGFRDSPRSTLLFPAFAQWFTDGFLMTNDDDRRRTRTNHQVDLSQLYGLTPATTRALRLLSEESGRKGRLKSVRTADGEWALPLFDASGAKAAEFADVPDPVRLPELPIERKRSLFAFGGERTNSTALISMINTLFLREHNRLAAIIEQAHPDWDDERVFQTARNTSIVQLIRIVIEEYINHISPFWVRLICDPKPAYARPWYREGWIPLEFNILYRLHSLVPDTIRWDGEETPLRDFLLDNRRLIEDGLGAAFDSASKSPAWRVGLFNTSAMLHAVEYATVSQARENHISSYNDYREAMKYPRVTRFEQISGDPDVVAALKRLYADVDQIEFYVGLLAEDTPDRAAVPPLLGRMVAVDAFSHLLSNPLLSRFVYNEATFSAEGMASIKATSTLGDLVDRNVAESARFRVSMEREGQQGYA